MSHATPIIRAAATTQKPTAKTASQKRRAVPALTIAQERQRSRACRPPAISPCGAAAYGFLKTRILPHYAGQAAAGSPQEKEGFYQSFARLCSHYAIAPADTQHFAYPYGRKVALHEAARLLRSQYPQRISIAFEEEGGDFSLNACERFDTSNTLFFIPVLPLHYLMQDKKRRNAAQLLLCIFAYLYRKAGVPYYTENDSYLCWNYDRIAEWVSYEPDDWEKEEYTMFMTEIRQALHYGEVMRRRLWSSVPLDRFAEWLGSFTPGDAFGRDCQCLAQKFYDLWQHFPTAGLYDHADSSCFPDPDSPDYDDYTDYDCITMEKYISFVATTEGWLYQRVEEAVNTDFNECNAMQEPVLTRCFDGREQSADTLDYECRLFPLINELCYLLNNCSYGT